VIIPKEYQGFKDVVHGGIIGTVLDEMMVNYHVFKKEKVVTAEYTVRLKFPCPVNKKILLSSRVLKQTSRLYYSSAEARLENGKLVAEATAVCMRIKNSIA
jgi:acyl-coenzyme A thioesterase PaaI-like protein